jgi:hypothetical protein
MDNTDEKSRRQLLVEIIWTYTGWTVVIFACIGAGVFIGHVKWGDAAALRVRVDQYEKQVLALRSERDTMIAKLTQERDACRKAGLSGAPAPAASSSRTE